MKKATRVGAMLAAMLAAQPLAASDFQDQQISRQPSAFVGLKLRLPLGQTVPAKPSLRLQFTTSRQVRDDRSDSIQTITAQGLEIGAAKGGKPAFYLNGESTAEMRNRLNIGGSNSTVLIVGGVVLVAVVLVAAASASGQSDLLNPCSGDSTLCN